MKTIITLLLLIPFLGFAQIKLPDQVKKVIPTKLPSSSSVLNSTDISKGLKEALNNGITKQVTKLTAEDGFYKNELFWQFESCDVVLGYFKQGCL